jgi:lysophospholipase L1-like esterase
MNRSLIVRIAATLFAASFIAVTAHAQRWTATWSPSQSATAARPAAGAVDRVTTLVNATLRQVIHTTIGGDRVRVRISNEYGDRPLVIGRVHVALRTSGSSINAASDRPLMFDGKERVVVRTGSVVTSDPLAFNVPALSDLVVTMYLPDSARTSTRHALALQTNYISRSGDATTSATFTADTTMHQWLFLTGVDVVNQRATGAIVAIGNSITDGAAATDDSNCRWPDVLARRLLESKSEPVKSVVNAGISGNRVLTSGTGPSLVARFDRDVLSIPGVTHVIILEGINDIGYFPSTAPGAVSAEEIIFGYKQVIQRAHERGLVVFGATLTPIEGMGPGATPDMDVRRQAVNTWIRGSKVFDGVIDFDLATRDPAQPGRFLPLYDSGDHLHPSDAGYKAMGDAIDLKLFRTKR